VNQQLPLKLRLAEHTRLEDYVGDAASRLQQLEGPVYVSGSAGTGKSHLLQGLCHQAIADGDSAIYLSSLDELHASVLEGLEAVDLVCLDGIEQVIIHQDWQTNLFHLINACRDQGGKLVASGRAAVASLNISLDDLASRLKGAYLLTTEELTDQQKLEVVKLKARRLGFTMSEEVCRFILLRSDRDMHHLARLVDRLDEETLRRQKKVTIPFVKAALGL